MSVTTSRPIPVRRGSLTIADCDRELGILRRRFRTSTDIEEKAVTRLDLDRWLDLRYELMQDRARIKRSLG